MPKLNHLRAWWVSTGVYWYYQTLNFHLYTPPGPGRWPHIGSKCGSRQWLHKGCSWWVTPHLSTCVTLMSLQLHPHVTTHTSLPGAPGGALHAPVALTQSCRSHTRHTALYCHPAGPTVTSCQCQLTGALLYWEGLLMSNLCSHSSDNLESVVTSKTRVNLGSSSVLMVILQIIT